MRLGFLSDLHITHNTNLMEQAVDVVVEASLENKIDKLFLAGDTSNNIETTFQFVSNLNKSGIETYTVLGNHEYWSTNYERAQKQMFDKYIHGKTININNDIAVIGIDGCFDYSFVLNVQNHYTENISKDIEKLTDIGKRTFDLSRNKIKNYKEVFDDMYSKLESQLKVNQGKHIIVVMHYVPHQNFVLYNTDKIWTINNSFMGSLRYHELFKVYGVNQVIFGHTHTAYNDIIDDIQYMCNPVGYGFEFEESFRDRVKNVYNVIDI